MICEHFTRLNTFLEKFLPKTHYDKNGKLTVKTNLYIQEKKFFTPQIKKYVIRVRKKSRDLNLKFKEFTE